jgi:magnesium-transporting ATPase (P-type)
MLTGDKMETAENIAKSCNLIQPQFRVLKYNWDKTDPASILLYLKNMKRRADALLADNKKICFMIAGDYITPIINDP